MWSRTLAMIAALVLLGGCASLTAQREYADEAELRANRGEPTRVWNNEDGTRTLEYATQPYGDTAWMYTVDAEGRVVEQLDALGEEGLARVRPGMTLEEVERLLGQHRSVQRFALSGEEVWDWNVRNRWPGVLATLFNVHFVDGKVVRTSYTYVYPRDGGWGIGMWSGPRTHWGMGWGWPHPWVGPHPWGWPYYW